jgi:hypothetical protein
MDNQEQAQTVADPVESQDQAQPQLGISDLQNLRVIVDTAVKRGAFGAGEISAVGATFDRLNAFLNAVAPAQTNQAPAA